LIINFYNSQRAKTLARPRHISLCPQFSPHKQMRTNQRLLTVENIASLDCIVERRYSSEKNAQR
jgi:hypothetical protein